MNPKFTRKQTERITTLSIKEVKKELAQKKELIEKMSGKKYEDYSLQKINQLKYILNSETPAFLVSIDVPNKGRIKITLKKMEDKV
jgi:hypothetical protein